MQPIYPRAFVTPSGRATSIRAMSQALRVIRQNPGAEYPGWEWFSVPGHYILKEFRRGLHDRINRRGAGDCKPCEGTGFEYDSAHVLKRCHVCDGATA